MSQGNTSEAVIRQALTTCLDPELGLDIVSLGLIYGITIQSNKIIIIMTLTTPGCPLMPYFKEIITTAVRTATGFNDISIEVTFDPPWSPEKMTVRPRNKSRYKNNSELLITYTYYMRLTAIIVSTLIALLIIGAGCQKKETPVVNTNASISTNTAIISNSSTTGSFTTGNTNTSNATAQMIITASGLQTSTMAVAIGTTVRFINNDQVSHQIASNPHPTHTDLPGFEGLIITGGEYYFTFDRVGNWGFHDHLNPTNIKFQGTIIVQ